MGNLDNNTTELENILKAVNDLPNAGSGTGTAGEDGGYYIPSVTQPDANTMQMSFTPSKNDMASVSPKSITLPKGDDGVGILSVKQTYTSPDDGGENVIVVTQTDNKTYAFTVKNGNKGADGENGADGKSPHVVLTSLSSGVTIDVYNADGTTATAKIKHGDAGADGADGVGIGGAFLNDDYTLTLIFTDGTMYTTPSIRGATGADGKDGSDGKDGVSVTHAWNGTALSVTSASGTSSVDLKGDKGDKGDTGATGATGPAGKDGKNPVVGVDYWTATDKMKMIEDIISSIITQETGGSESLVMSQKAVTDFVAEAVGTGGGTSTEYETVDSVDDMTDTSKQYVLKETGTIWTYGETGEVPNYTNLATIVTPGLRLNSSGGTSESPAVGVAVVEDYIPVANGDIVRVKGLTLGGYNVAQYNSSKEGMTSAKPTFPGTSDNLTFGNVTDGVYPITAGNTLKYIRVSGILVGATSDVIITKNEEIAYTMGCGWYDTELTLSTGGGGGGNYVELLVKVNKNTTDINEVSNRVTALETGNETVTIPTFWQSAVDAVIAKIKALQVGRNCVTFPFFSDNHQNNKYAGVLIAHIMKECNIPYCFFGGDSISNGQIADEATMIAQDKAFDTMMSYVPNGRMCRAVGNHDGYWYDGTNKYYYTDAQIYELFLREESIAQNKHFGGDGTYYYVEDIASKVRWIVLDTNDGTVETEQISWLQNTALSFSESGWAVVFISHQPISNHYHAGISNAEAVRTVVKNYINGSSANKADIVGWYSGHIHRDRIYSGIGINTTDDTEGTAMGFKQVTITSDHTGIAYDDATKHTIANDDKSHAIDFVTINKATRTVNITRLGIGNDRSYTY